MTLQEELVQDYIAWVDQALHPMGDTVGIRNIAVENFKLKLKKLLDYANKTKSGEISDVRD